MLGGPIFSMDSVFMSDLAIVLYSYHAVLGLRAKLVPAYQWTVMVSS